MLGPWGQICAYKHIAPTLSSQRYRPLVRQYRGEQVKRAKNWSLLIIQALNDHLIKSYKSVRNSNVHRNTRVRSSSSFFVVFLLLSEMKAFTMPLNKDQNKLSCQSQKENSVFHVKCNALWIYSLEYVHNSGKQKAEIELSCRLPKVCKNSVLCTFYVPYICYAGI